MVFPFTFPSAMYYNSNSHSPLMFPDIFAHFNASHPIGCVVVSHCDFNLLSLMNKY